MNKMGVSIFEKIQNLTSLLDILLALKLREDM